MLERIGEHEKKPATVSSVGVFNIFPTSFFVELSGNSISSASRFRV